jgi:hypothetical protein
MKQALAALVLSLLLSCSQAQNPYPWIGTYHCFQLQVQTPEQHYYQNTAISLTLQENSSRLSLSLENLRAHTQDTFRVQKFMGEVLDEGDVVRRYWVRSDRDSLEGTLFLRYHQQRLAQVTLAGAEYAVALTIFYPLYRKI